MNSITEKSAFEEKHINLEFNLSVKSILLL